MTNPLREYFESNSGRLIDKWLHYFDIYHRHFERVRGGPLTLVELGEVDIVIDDGAHMLRHQAATFEEMYPAVAEDGVYLVEDLHTGYWPEYGGGVGRKTLFGNRVRPGSFTEYAKDLVDKLNAWHSRDPERLAVDDFTRSTRNLHFYDSVLVVEKGTATPPTSKKTGTPSFDDGHRPSE